MNIKLPNVIIVNDYHEFGMIEDYLKQLDVKVVVEEVGFDYEAHGYVGCVYQTKTKAVSKMIDKMKAEFDKMEEECYG